MCIKSKILWRSVIATVFLIYETLLLHARRRRSYFTFVVLTLRNGVSKQNSNNILIINTVFFTNTETGFHLTLTHFYTKMIFFFDNAFDLCCTCVVHSFSFLLLYYVCALLSCVHAPLTVLVSNKKLFTQMSQRSSLSFLLHYLSFALLLCVWNIWLFVHCLHVYDNIFYKYMNLNW